MSKISDALQRAQLEQSVNGAVETAPLAPLSHDRGTVRSREMNGKHSDAPAVQRLTAAPTPETLAVQLQRQGQWLARCAERTMTTRLELDAARRAWLHQVETVWMYQQLSAASRSTQQALHGAAAKLAHLAEETASLREQLSDYRRRSESFHQALEHLQASLART